MARHPNGDVIVDSGGFPANSLDALEWAEAFAAVDNFDSEQLATWFAAAMITGQQSPSAVVIQDF